MYSPTQPDHSNPLSEFLRLLRARDREAGERFWLEFVRPCTLRVWARARIESGKMSMDDLAGETATLFMEFIDRHPTTSLESGEGELAELSKYLTKIAKNLCIRSILREQREPLRRLADESDDGRLSTAEMVHEPMVHESLLLDLLLSDSLSRNPTMVSSVLLDGFELVLEGRSPESVVDEMGRAQAESVRQSLVDMRIAFGRLQGESTWETVDALDAVGLRQANDKPFSPNTVDVRWYRIRRRLLQRGGDTDNETT